MKGRNLARMTPLTTTMRGRSRLIEKVRQDDFCCPARARSGRARAGSAVATARAHRGGAHVVASHSRLSPGSQRDLLPLLFEARGKTPPLFSERRSVRQSDM